MKKIIALSVLAAMSGFALHANEPSFNFVEAGYTDLDDIDGYTIRGNAEINDNFFFTGSYEMFSDSTSVLGTTVDTDIDFVTLGLGYKQNIGSNMSVYTQLSYVHSDASVRALGLGGSDSDNGYQIGLGVRSQIADKTQFYGEVTHLNIDGASTILTLGLRQNFNDNFAMYIEAMTDDYSGDGYSVGVGYHF